MKLHLPLVQSARPLRYGQAVLHRRVRRGVLVWFRTRLLVPLALVAVGLAGVAVPAAAQEQPEPCPLATGDDAVAEEELAALELAAACDREIEVLGERDEFSQVYALPTGDLRAEIGVEPVRAVDDSGQWAPIDTTLEITVDGVIRPVNITEDVAFSPGGTAPMATVTYEDAETFALSWPEALPEPVLEGARAVYDEVLPGVALVLEATAQGFRYDLVVADAEAAANPELEAIDFAVEATGGELIDSGAGIVEVHLAGQAVLESASAQMWEAPADHTDTDLVPPLQAVTDSPASADQQVAPVSVDVEDQDLVLRPDLELLRGEDTRYPVVIDPLFTGQIQSSRWGLVISRSDVRGDDFYQGKNNSGNYFLSNTGRDGNAGAGRTCDNWSGLTCTSTEYIMRSFFRMDTDNITQDDYKIPRSSKFKIIQKHSADCNNGTARLWHAGGYNSNHTWNHQPSWNEHVTTSSADHGAGCGGSAYVEWNVTSMVNKAEANEWANLTLGLRAADESPSPDLAQWNRFDASSARLEITYDVMPYYPKELQLNGAACTSVIADAPWINDRTPELSAKVSSKDTTVKWELRVRESGSGGPIVYEYKSGSLASGNRQTRTVPSASALPDGSYYWLARAISTSNASLISSWSPACRLTVDATKPATPTVALTSEAPYAAGQDLSLTLSSTDPVVNGVASGIVKFEYSWGTGTYDLSEASTGAASLELADAAPGRHVLYVRAVDAAGNKSFERTFTFFVGSDIPAVPEAAWRFEGDTFDDTDYDHIDDDGNDLTPVTGTVAYTADRDGRADAALALDGQTCLTTDDGDPDTDDHAVRTDAAFSVAAWVRVDTAEDWDKALVQAGAEHSAFQLQYSADEDKWYFSMLSSPGGDFVWRSVGAAATAAPGEWQHVAGMYDPDAGVTQIYIDGQLINELEVDFTPWHESYVLGVGCLLNAEGETSNFVTGAIDQVGLWSGLLNAEQLQAAMTDLPGASLQAQWSFSGDDDGIDDGSDDGDDTSGYGRDLTIPAGVTIGSDPFGRPSGAVELDGSTCLEHPSPAIATDRSFSVGAWIHLDDLDSHGTVAATAGEQNTGFRLRYSATYQRFEFVMFTADAPTGGETTWLIAADPIDGETDRWYHLTSVYDAPANEMRLYVDGQLQDTRTGPTEPWAATGSTLVGCAGPEGGFRTDFWTGSLHDVNMWRGAVDSVQIATMLGDPPGNLAAWWALDTSGDDWSPNGHGLTLVDNYSWVTGRDGTGQGAFALEFGGGGYAHTAGPVVDTDEAFTVSAWVKLDDLAADGVAVSITGDDRGVIDLKYSQTEQAWQFAAPPTADLDWRAAESETAPTAGEWTFLVGVYDLSRGELRLYVNGDHAGTATGVVLPASTGPLVVGAEGNADGTIRDGLIGAVDDVRIWQGAISDSTIEQLSPGAEAS